MATYEQYLKSIKEQEEKRKQARQDALSQRLASAASSKKNDKGSDLGSKIIEGGKALVKGIYDSTVGAAVNTAENIWDVVDTDTKQKIQTHVLDEARKTQKKAQEDFDQGKIDENKKNELITGANDAVQRVSTLANEAQKKSNKIDPAKAAGDAATTALNVGTLGTVGAIKTAVTGGARAGAEVVGNAGAKAALESITTTSVKSKAAKLAANAGKEAALGAGYGLTTTASTEGSDATAADYARNAAIGGITGAAIPVVVAGAKKAIPAIRESLVQARLNPERGSIKLPGKAPETPTPVVEPPVANPTDALPIHGRINPDRTNPAGLPEALPKTSPDAATTPVTDGAGNPAFVEGKADPKVFGSSAQLINIAKDKYIAAVKTGDVDQISLARKQLRAVPTDRNGTVAKNDLLLRIDDYADSGAAQTTEATTPVGYGSTQNVTDSPVPALADDGTPIVPDDITHTTAEQADARFFNREQQLKDTKPNAPLLEKADMALFDRNAPLRIFEREAKNNGKKLAAEDDPHALAQLVNGAPEAAVENLRGVFNDMKYIKQNNMADELMRYGVAKQVVADRAGDYPESVVKEMQGTIARIESELPPEQMAQLEAARRNIVDYHNEQIVRLKDEGQLSEDWYKNIREKNSEYFTGFNFQEHTNGNERGFSKNSKNNSQSPLQSVRGVSDDGKFVIEDPTTAIPRQAIRLEQQLANHRVIDAVNRYTEANPESGLAIRLNTPEDIEARIDLNIQNKGLKPIRDGLVKAVSRDTKTASKLMTVINNLEKKGLNTSLKDGGQRLPDGTVKTTDGLGGDVSTAKAAAGDKSELGPQDTARFFRSLIEDNSRSQIDKIKKQIGYKDGKLTELLDNIGTLRSEFDDVATQIKANRQQAIDLADKDVPDGFEAIETWQDGKKVRTAVLQPIADALKGKNDIQVGTIESILGKGSRPFRAAATVASPGFAPFTGIKDFGQWLLTSENVPVAERALVIPAAARYAKGLFNSVFNTDLAKLAAKAGAGGANTLARDTEKLVEASAKKFGGKSVTSTKDMFKAASDILTFVPRKYMDAAAAINKHIEYAPKLAEFEAALQKNKSVQGAAVDARNAVADMQNAGVVGRVLNNFIPFTNATLQGTGKLVKYAKAHPGTFTGLAGATVALPAITAYSWNASMFPEVWDDVSQDEKDTDFIIILGNNKDAAGRYTDIIKIPKTDAAKLVAAPIEAGLAAINDKDHDSITTLLLKSAGFVTPIDVERDGEFSGQALLNSTLGANPLVKVPFELGTNTNLFTGNAITPDSLQGLDAADQVKANTSPIDKGISAVTGGAINPLEAQIVRQGVTAGLGNTDPGTQLTKRFVGARGGSNQQEFYKLVGDVRDDRAKASNAINKALAAGDLAAAQNIVQRYNQNFRTTMDPWVKEHGASANSDMKDTFTGLQLNLTSSSVKQRLKTIAKKQAAAAEK